jgi:hypothetical protein|tara:strand:- start:301 stop:657 length:357 start_codon:yes stop_codon:yes gene_type:complete
MATKETYLYFAENLGADASGDSAVWPASNFTGIDPISATTTRISFKATTGNAADDDILITHVTGKYKEVCEALADALSYQGNDMVVFADEDNGIYWNKFRELGCFDPDATELNITLDT